MAWVRIDDQAPHHRKMLLAGPAACWLWICAIAHSQRQLTDGVIDERTALPLLGVSNPKPLIVKLLEVGLLDLHPDGWRVHDYLDWNEDRETVLARRRKTSQARSTAGRESAAKRRTNGQQTPDRFVDNDNEQTGNNDNEPYKDGCGVVLDVRQRKESDESFDQSFEAFVSAYPEPRRSRSLMVQQQFVVAIQQAGTVAVLFEALANHCASDAWQDVKYVPKMGRWLDEQQWRNRLDPPKPKPDWNPKGVAKQPAWMRS